jgi:2-polyprenyl-6-methoxyphenol hydroxylase-like FAD-dependent oxidoreductase
MQDALASPPRERVLIVGAGIAGLVLAHALERSGGFAVDLVDRDKPPGPWSSQEAFSAWPRRGVAQFRQTHFFLPRIREHLSRRFPDVYDELLRSGARELTVAEALPPRLARSYVPVPADQENILLLCRRATLEAVLRQRLARCGAVRLRAESTVDGVLVRRARDAVPALVGVRVRTAQACSTEEADVIVDASGRAGRFETWLREEGVPPAELVQAAIDQIYLTRHFRLIGGAAADPTFRRPTAGRAGAVGYAICPGDNATFALSLVVRHADLRLRQDLAHADRFLAACRAIGALAPWVDTAVAEPTTAVLPMAGLQNYWRSYVDPAGPRILGYFAIGDALAQSNPTYGSGCSWAVHAGLLLADTLAQRSDPTERALWFDRRLRVEVRPYFELMHDKDRRRGYLATRGKQPPAAPRRPIRERMGAVVDALVEIGREEDVRFARWQLQQRYMTRLVDRRRAAAMLLVHLLRSWGRLVWREGLGAASRRLRSAVTPPAPGTA